MSMIFTIIAAILFAWVFGFRVVVPFMAFAYMALTMFIFYMLGLFQ